METQRKIGSYTIRELEQLTGVKAHTIRIWEQRYGLLAPERTTTNIRYYSSDQLKRLLNISSLLRKGMKISKVSKLPDTQVNVHLTDMYLTDTIESEIEDKINSLVLAAVDFNEGLFESVFASAVRSMGFYDTILKLIYPFLNKVGMLWVTTQMHPGQEHFISNLIRQKIIAAFDQIKFQPQTHAKKFVLFLPEWETHEISLLLSNYIIRAAGHQTIYLGQNLPSKDFPSVVEAIKPDVLVFMITSPQTQAKMAQLFKHLSEFTHLPILLSGNPNYKAMANEVKGFTWLITPSDLIEFCKNISK